MRSSTFSSFAILATALLVKDVCAGRYDARKRDELIKNRAVITDLVLVTEEIVVTAMPDGSHQTGKGKPVGTSTIAGVPIVVTSVSPISTVVPTTTAEPTTAEPTTAPEPIPEPVPSSFSVEEVIPSSTPAAAFHEQVTTPSAEPTSTTTPTPSPVGIPTTLATVASSSAAAVKTPVSQSGSGKRGIAYNDASYLSAFTGNAAVTWAYNWGDSTSKIPSNYEFVPMLWGLGQHAVNWEKNANAAIAAGSTHLLAFNEPDLAAQANLDAATAAAGYLQHMQPYAGKAKLGSPAVTNGGDPMGLTYLSNFISACSTCTIDFINIHWYNGGDATAFKEYMAKAYKAGGNRPIWITEFEAPGTSDEQIAFLEEVIPWLDSQDYIQRYAYFMASDGRLISGTSLSSLGRKFASI